MAGDRGLAFVVVGLIGLSALFVSNHGRIDRAPARAHAAGIVSEPISEPPEILSRADGSFEALDDTSYIFRMHRRISDKEAVTGMYPELTGSTVAPLTRIRQRLRLLGDAGLTPPLN